MTTSQSPHNQIVSSFEANIKASASHTHIDEIQLLAINEKVE